MQPVQPKCYWIANPDLTDEFDDFLRDNNIEWVPESEEPAEILAEFAGRLCYESWENTDNLNITKTRKGGYLENIIKQGHGSVFEHGGLVFLFNNVSRVFTHELVRHRAGSAFSQTSGRYVRLRDIKFWIPDIIAENPDAKLVFEKAIAALEGCQEALESIYNIDALPFHEKKILTSAFRRIAPCGLANNILWSTNHRALRHVIAMRTAEGAEVEIQTIFRDIAKRMREYYPAIYADMEELPDGSFRFCGGKI